MNLPRMNCVLLLLHFCYGRPHQTDSISQTTVTPQEGYFAPGAWQPVSSDTTSRTHQLHIDQDISRVRLETGGGGKQRGGKSENVAVSQDVTTDNARAKQSPVLGDSIQSLANQLLGYGRESDQSARESEIENSSDSMVEEDVRTPPKLKSQIKHKQNKPVTSSTESQETHHKGVAVPVIIEDDEDVEKTIEKISNTEPLGISHILTHTTPKKRHPTKVTTPLPSTTTVSRPYYETTSSDGVSTWILLTGSSTTTPTIKRKNNKTPAPTYAKTTSTATTTSHLTKIFDTTTKRFVETGNSSSSGVSPVTASNQTNTIDFFKPTRTRKPHPTRTTPTTTVSEITTGKHQKVVNRVTTVKPPVVTIIRVPDSSLQEEIITTEVSTEITTNETNHPAGNKKKNKNKNRRRRPSKKPGSSENLESKVDDSNSTSSDNKVSVKERPLSTRIYNYLAREVMPSVGVGLIGLVVTAGLAGLFMYPFGGGVTRRTYEEPGYHRMPPNTYYQGDIEGGQSEEEVFGKLLEGMNDKGEFTYSSLGEETSGYAGMDSHFPNQRNDRYNTASKRVEDATINQNLRYGNSNAHGGRVSNSQQDYPTITTVSDSTVRRSEYGDAYYSNFQPQMNDMYKGLSVVGSQNYGKVQSGDTPSETKYKTIQNPEPYRRVVSDNKQQYIDVVGTQPRTIAASLVQQHPRNDMSDYLKFKPVQDGGNGSKEKQVADDRTLEVDNGNLQYRGFSGVANSEVSPRSLRSKRNVDSASKSENQTSSSKSNDVNTVDISKLKDIDISDNKIDSGDKNSKKKENIKNKGTDNPIGMTDNRMDANTTEEGKTTHTVDEDLITDNTTSEDELPTTTAVDDSIPPVTITTNQTLADMSKNKTVINKVQDTQFSLLGLFKRITHFKLQIGLNLLKSTSQAFTDYIDRVQKRINRDYTRSQDGNRHRRDIFKS